MNPYVNAYKKNAVERKSRNRRNLFSAAVLVIFFLLGISFLLVYKHTLGQQLLLEVQQLKAAKKEMVTEQSVLLGEKQCFLSRSRIISYAQEFLDLDFPGPQQIRWIRLETTTGEKAKSASR